MTKEKPLKNQNSFAHSQKKQHPLISINGLSKTYPNCFDHKNPKPLKKGILQDILEQGLWTESKTDLNQVLSFYAGVPLYHQAILEETFGMT